MARQLGCRCAELPGLTSPWLFVHLNPLYNIPFPCSVSLIQPARGAAFHTQSCDLCCCWEHSWLSLWSLPHTTPTAADPGGQNTSTIATQKGDSLGSALELGGNHCTFLPLLVLILILYNDAALPSSQAPSLPVGRRGRGHHAPAFQSNLPAVDGIHEPTGYVSQATAAVEMMEQPDVAGRKDLSL